MRIGSQVLAKLLLGCSFVLMLAMAVLNRFHVEDGSSEGEMFWQTEALSALALSHTAGSPHLMPSRREDHHLDLLIMVPSHWSEVERRCAIRDSWLLYFADGELCSICQRFVVAVIFTVGGGVLDQSSDIVEAFLAEQRQFGDIEVLRDFPENTKYKERATKTLRSVSHAVQHFKFTLLLKVDTDSYVFADRLLNVLDVNNLFDATRRVYAGNFIAGAGAKVVRPSAANKDNLKWVDTSFENTTGLHMYPRHAKGAGYLLSRPLAEYLAHTIDSFAEFPCEDTAVGAYVAAVEHQQVHFPVALQSEGCHDRNVLIDHYVVPSIMRRRWRRLEVFGDACFAPPQQQLQGTSREAPPQCTSGAWRIALGAFGLEVSSEALIHYENLKEHYTTRSGSCWLGFSWRSGPWDTCRSQLCTANTDEADALGYQLRPVEQRRCVDCQGTDGAVYDDWECLASPPPLWQRECNASNETAGSCVPLFSNEESYCSANTTNDTANTASNRSSETQQERALPAESSESAIAALRLMKDILGTIPLPAFLAPDTAHHWSGTCALPPQELCLMALHRDTTPLLMRRLEDMAQKIGFDMVLRVRKTHSNVGLMLVWRCPPSLCGAKYVVRFKVAEESGEHFWWPLWRREVATAMWLDAPPSLQ
eukprot:CAMPEP_0178385202 /NCGR_PEP_ID=MMETSP0689_2-20121128/7913_1 /TAXON_ID=160604 /ORGANISM="Amphidinium massartii, Strain CS-259" /LENGTH=648 /DNA_ID=CAMNT_0020005481 /DNA_START=41 /DNA_END=1984 /DNA_ORIENTATION=+